MVVTAELSANSLLLGPFKENIMESYMVKYYCNMLIPNESCEVELGYAVTRLELNKLQKSSNGKPGKASFKSETGVERKGT